MGLAASVGPSGYHFAARYGADPESTHRRASDGDEEAIDVFNQVGEALADTVSRLANETQIAVVVIGGGLANAWDLFRPALQARIRPLGISATRTGLAKPSLVGAAALFGV